MAIQPMQSRKGGGGTEGKPSSVVMGSRYKYYPPVNAVQHGVHDAHLQQNLEKLRIVVFIKPQSSTD